MPRHVRTRTRKAATRAASFRVERLEVRELLASNPLYPKGLIPSPTSPTFSAEVATPFITATPFTNTATFSGEDTTTQGSWEGAYGADGYDIAYGPASIPAYATLTVDNPSGGVFDGASTNPAAPQVPGSSSRLASAWTGGAWALGTTVSVDVHIADGQAHRVSLYAADWPGGTSEAFRVTDDATGAVLDTRSLSSFAGGAYLSWDVTGDVTISVSNTAGDTALLSAVYFDPATSAPTPGGTATFSGEDTTTQGSWEGAYGADGYDIAYGPASIPAYATLTVDNPSGGVFDGASTNPAAPQVPGSSSRLASAWTGGAWALGTTVSVDVHIADGQAHRVSLYAADWPGGTSEAFRVTDDATGAVLDTRSLSSFAGGAYLSWDVTGDVTISVSNTAGDTALLSAVYFDPATSAPTPGPPVSAPYSPAEIRQAYGFNQLGQDGTGQTIAIVDAYNDPNIANDLAVFDAQYNLPAANLVVATPQGKPGYDSGWSLETSLDVEWAHAIAPGATILLVEAKSASNADLFGAVNYAVQQGAKQVSMSWGGGEGGDTSYDSYFNHRGVTFLASSGDNGAGVSYPAASPYVTGVGGTSFSFDANGNRVSETAWSGSGGGASSEETVPSYQTGFVGGSGRGVPDVSYDADPNTGVSVYDSGWYQVGGTSAGAPQWAGLIALVNQGRSALGKSSIGTGLAFGTNTALYALAGGNGYTNPNGDFYDVTSGSSGISAAKGYDEVTGLGSPVANKLVRDLINS